MLVTITRRLGQITQRNVQIIQKYFMSDKADHLKRENGRTVAYREEQGGSPGIIFCPGFPSSNMHGVKAMALKEYCIKNKLGFVRFDYQGTGESIGDLRDITFADWKDDVLAVIDHLTAGPQILVGSSTGAWLMLMAALERPFRIHSVLGVAPAPDFNHRFLKDFLEDSRDEMKKEGEALLESKYGNYTITKAFLDEAENMGILNKPDSLPIRCPVRLLHGMADDVVPYQTSLNLCEKLQSRDILVLLRKNGSHHFSQPDDIQMLFEELDYLVHGSWDARNLAIVSWSSFSVYSRPDELIVKDNSKEPKQ